MELTFVKATHLGSTQETHPNQLRQKLTGLITFNKIEIRTQPNSYVWFRSIVELSFVPLKSIDNVEIPFDKMLQVFKMKLFSSSLKVDFWLSYTVYVTSLRGNKFSKTHQRQKNGSIAFT